MVKDHSDNEETCCHMSYYFQLVARVLLYTTSHRQDSIYHSLCYTSHGTLAGTEREREMFYFNDTLNTFYLRLFGIRHMVKGHSDNEETCCCHMSYYFQLAARALLYATSHRQDSTYHSFCYTSHEALAGTRNNSMGPP